jgi:predicted nuclease with TOPRIM domain
VEDLLAENQKLSVNTSSSQQQQSSVGRRAISSNNNNNQQEMEELHQQLEKLTKENTLLKTQLNMSESLRQKGHQALGELKHEFRALYKELTTDAAPPFSFKNNKQQQREGTPAAVQEGGLVPGSV